MEPKLNRDGWSGSFDGWLMVDVAIRENGVICFLLRQRIEPEKISLMNDHDIPTRIVTFSLLRPRSENQRSHQGLTGFNIPVLGVWRVNNTQSLGIVAAKNKDGDTWAMGGKNKGAIENIANNQNPFPTRLKCINGYTYAVCAYRKIYKRVRDSQWELFADLPEIKNTMGMGFNDLDAFSESDMYAVGGSGDIWHYNGNGWKQLGFPTNAQLATVTCAPDGNVYVTGEGGSLWVGRNDVWKRVHEGNSSVLWNDALWFDGKLWLSSDYQLRIWDGEKMHAPQENGKLVPAYGHMDVLDRLLVVAGPDFAYGFDGNTWELLVAPYWD